jgi:hypothetical protein
MTTNRETIAQAINSAHEATLDDLMTSCEMDRKRLIDTVNGLRKADLVERFKDDLTGLPAYRMTKKGSAWLINRPAIENAQPAVAKNTGSKAAPSFPIGISIGAGDAVEQPAPEAVASSTGAGNETINRHVSQIIDFCEWLKNEAGLKRIPLNLTECKDAIKGEIVSKITDAQIAAIKPLGYIVALPENHKLHDSEADAMEYAKPMLSEEESALICAVVAEGKAQITWSKAA